MKKYYIGLILLYVLVYILPLGGRPMLTPDEFRYGEIPREMLETGNWTAPKLIGVRYFEKPVMGYWLNALSIMAFGENAFAVRFASALSTGLAALMLFFLVLKFHRDPEEALLAAGLFLSFGMVFGVGTFAVLDAPTMFFISGTLISFYWGCEQEKWGWRKITALAVAGIFAGFAFLTKGFLAFAVPAVTVIPYLIWTKRWKQIFTLPWIPLAFTVIVSLPWALMIHRQEPGFWNYFFWDEHVKRFLDSAGTHHPEPFYFYIPFLFLGALPLLLFIPGAFVAFRKRFNDLIQDKLIKFAFCWLVFPFLFFSACRGKLPTYILPCFMPFAVLFSRGLIEYFRAGKTKIFDVTARILIVLAPVGAFGFAVVQIIADCGVFRGMYAPEERWKWILAGCAVALLVICLYKMSKAKAYRTKAAFLLAGPAMVMAVSFFIIPERYLSGKAQGLFLEQFKERVKPGMTIIAHPNVMHAAAWEFRNKDILFYTHGGELEMGLKYKDSKKRLISRRELSGLIKKGPPGKIIFIMRGDFREDIPEGAEAVFEKYDHEIMFSNF
ncbi:MAG: phospholipid carrier-dependent glycosyltransferase [Victivallales bacterium]